MNNLRRSNSTTQVNQRVNSSHRYSSSHGQVSVCLSVLWVALGTHHPCVQPPCSCGGMGAFPEYPELCCAHQELKPSLENQDLVLWLFFLMRRSLV